MKNRLRKIAIALLSATMLMSTAVVVSAEEAETESVGTEVVEEAMEEDADDILGGLIDFATVVWAELPEEDKTAIVEEVQEVLNNEEVQGYLSVILEEIPEEVQPLVSDIMIALMGIDVDEASEDSAVPASVTHDEILEATGIDLPEDDTIIDYNICTFEDGTQRVGYTSVSDDTMVCYATIPDITDFKEAAPYFSFSDEDVELFEYDEESDAYFCEYEEGVMYFVVTTDEETGNICLYSILALTDDSDLEGIIDEEVEEDVEAESETETE